VALAASIPVAVTALASNPTLFSATGVPDHHSGTNGSCFGGASFSVDAGAPFASAYAGEPFLLTPSTPTADTDAGLNGNQLKTTVTSVSPDGTTVGLASACSNVPPPFEWDIGTDNSGRLTTCLNSGNCSVDKPNSYMFLETGGGVTPPQGAVLSCVQGSTLSFPQHDTGGVFLNLSNSSNTVTGCTFVGSNPKADYIPGQENNFLISIWGSSNNVVFGNVVENGWSDGDIDISGNASSTWGTPPCYPGNWPTWNGSISLTNPTPTGVPGNNLVEGNTVANCGFNGITIATGNGNVIEGNTITNCNVDIEPNDSCINGPVFYNLVYGNSLVASGAGRPYSQFVTLNGASLKSPSTNSGAGQGTIDIAYNNFWGPVWLENYCVGFGHDGGPSGQPWFGNQAYDTFSNPCTLNIGTCAVVPWSYQCTNSMPSVASSNNVYRLYYNGSSWINDNLTGENIATPARPSSTISSFRDGSGNEQTFYTANTGHVYQLVHGSSSWSQKDLTQAVATAPPAASCSGETTYLSSDGQHVVYVGADQHVHQFYYNFGTSTWTDQDLTAASGSPQPIACTSLSSFYLSGTTPTQHIIFMGWDQYLYQLTASSPTWHWTWQQLGPSVALGSTIAAYATQTGQQHIAFVGSDQYVHQMWYNGSYWTAQNLGVPGMSGAGLSAITSGSRQYVFFVDPNQHVHQVTYDNASATDFDFTGQGYGPPALAGSGVSAYFSGNLIPYVAYVGNDSVLHLNEGGGHWSTQPLSSTSPVSSGSGVVSGFADRSTGHYLYYLSSN
jgi:parallel beta-helix repeat protein